ncbi:MAG: DUF445 domain-containing protein [Thermocrispum agreste]|uniref:DUF445 domain-containing protein n=3 Tax=Thermocrispum agreste TaxID=37925 RepID=A0ABD6FE74_9PSEU
MHWAVLLSIPLTAAAVGLATRALIVVLLFKPRKFLGVGPLGWYGAVPRSAGKLAAVNADLLTGRMLTTQQLFADVDPQRLFAEVEQPLLRTIDTVAHETLAKHHPTVWEALPLFVQDMVVKRLQAAAPWIVRELVDRLRGHADWVVDIRDIVLRRLSDPDRMSRLIRAMTIADLRRSSVVALGAGLLAGVVEAAVLAVVPWKLLLPVFGAAVAVSACWVAAEWIFRPRRPHTVGRLLLRGPFHRRRAAITKIYAGLVAEEVLTPAVLLDALANGVERRQARAVLEDIVDELVDEQVRALRTLVSATIGTDQLPAMKRTAAARALENLPYTARPAHRYLGEAMAVQRRVSYGLAELTDAEFELLARPALQSARWALTVIVAVAGAAVGAIQMMLPLT